MYDDDGVEMKLLLISVECVYVLHDVVLPFCRIAPNAKREAVSYSKFLYPVMSL